MNIRKQIFIFLFAHIFILSPTHLKPLQKQSQKKIEIRPFCAYRPNNKFVKKIASFSYDITPQDAHRQAYNNKQSFLHISNPEVDMNPTCHMQHTIRGELGKKALQHFIEKRWLIQDKKPAFYIYAREKNKNRHVGIIAEIALKNYKQGLIKRSERIIPHKKKALVKFIDTLNASIDPVILIYSPSKKIDKLVQVLTQKKPHQDFFDEDGSRHTIWRINNPDLISLIQYYFSLIPITYIADGHHRAAAAQTLQENRRSLKKQTQTYTGQESFNYLLAALFPANQIEIHPYNRLIKNFNGLTKKEFLTKLKDSFEVKKVSNYTQANPSQTRCFGMYCENQWYAITLKEKIFQHYRSNPFKSLSMNILNRLILQPIFHMHIKQADNIEFIGGEESLKKLEKACKEGEGQIAFALSPVTADVFMKIVEADRLMPAKTTWFEPKMKLGLFTRCLGEDF